MFNYRIEANYHVISSPFTNIYHAFVSEIVNFVVEFKLLISHWSLLFRSAW